MVNVVRSNLAPLENKNKKWPPHEISIFSLAMNMLIISYRTALNICSNCNSKGGPEIDPGVEDGNNRLRRRCT